MSSLSCNTISLLYKMNAQSSLMKPYSCSQPYPNWPMRRENYCRKWIGCLNEALATKQLQELWRNRMKFLMERWDTPLSHTHTHTHTHTPCPLFSGLRQTLSQTDKIHPRATLGVLNWGGPGGRILSGWPLDCCVGCDWKDPFRWNTNVWMNTCTVWGSCIITMYCIL